MFLQLYIHCYAHVFLCVHARVLVFVDLSCVIFLTGACMQLGGNYALIDTTSLQPHPDYFTAVLWKRYVLFLGARISL